MSSSPATTIPRVSWETFRQEHWRWRAGEHVTLIGPTESGKTTLALAIIEDRRYVLALATKPRDKTMDALVHRRGWRLVRKWAQMPNVLGRACRVVLWPKYRSPDDEAAQAVEIATAMREAFAEGGWCLFIDELWYIEKKLGCSRLVETWYTQGRSNGLSVLAGTQRPAHVTLLAYDQPKHVFFWRDNDERNLKRISGLNGLNSRLIRETVATLPQHHVLYCNLVTGAMVVTKAPKP